ncbi:formin-like protein 20 [Mus caroli]|uniref:Formin-like protein 20 n=1 Tax=Mus caroli TaxID=10089 RepID=A0A6P5PZQ1_MUSCR|nr:formin-like protein 20 [Mus caroli]
MPQVQGWQGTTPQRLGEGQAGGTRTRERAAPPQHPPSAALCARRPGAHGSLPRVPPPDCRNCHPRGPPVPLPRPRSGPAPLPPPPPALISSLQRAPQETQELAAGSALRLRRALLARDGPPRRHRRRSPSLPAAASVAAFALKPGARAPRLTPQLHSPPHPAASRARLR